MTLKEILELFASLVDKIRTVEREDGWYYSYIDTTLALLMLS